MPTKEELQLKRLQKLKGVLSVINENAVDREEVMQVLKVLIDFVKKSHEDGKRAIETMLNAKNESIRTINSKHDTSLNEIKSFVKSELGNFLNTFGTKKEIEDKLLSLNSDRDKNLNTIANNIITKIREEIPVIKENTPEHYRDSLENLIGKDRLSINAINGLEELLEEWKKEINDGRRPLGGGGFSKIHMESKFIDFEEPAGTKNGVNKVFTLNHAPNPTTSLHLFRGGARQSTSANDYTLSGKTITFTTAPASGEELVCDYRI